MRGISLLPTDQSTDLDPELAVEQLVAVRAFVGSSSGDWGSLSLTSSCAHRTARPPIDWPRSWAAGWSEHAQLARSAQCRSRTWLPALSKAACALPSVLTTTRVVT